jgi:hypothetical protein
MEIIFEDAVLTPVADDSPLFDLRFYKNVKKRDTGEIVRELGSPLYGLTLYSAIKRTPKVPGPQWLDTTEPA